MRYVVGGLVTGTAEWFSITAPAPCADCGAEHPPRTVMLHLKHNGGPPEALCQHCTQRGIRSGLLWIDGFSLPPGFGNG